MVRATHTHREARSSAIAETARITIRSVTAVNRLTLTLTVTLDMTQVNFVSLIGFSIRVILFQKQTW